MKNKNSLFILNFIITLIICFSCFLNTATNTLSIFANPNTSMLNFYLSDKSNTIIYEDDYVTYIRLTNGSVISILNAINTKVDSNSSTSASNTTIESTSSESTTTSEMNSVPTIATIPIKNANINIPILTYHDITTNDFVIGNVQLTQERFKQDMLYLQENGYTPLLVDDFINIANNTQLAPEKPIMITFDDGYISNYELAFPILKETNMKAIIGVIAINIRDDAGKGLHTFLSWEQCKEMYESGLVDIENHTYNLHNPDTGGRGIVGGINGIGKHPTESEYEYKQRLKNDLETCNYLIESNVGNIVKYFAHPYGYTEDLAYEVFEEIGIEVATNSKVEVAKIEQDNLKLGRLSINMSESLEEVLIRYGF
ncbi:MAG: polysaccharide deacetylase family protein [bacterium]